MGRIILTVAGPWHKRPQLDTVFSLTLGPPDPQFVDDFRALVGSEFADGDALAVIGQHTSLITADLAFDGPGNLQPARDGARLVADLFATGAVGAIVQTGFKAHSPLSFHKLELRDPRILFHLFVEVLGDDEEIATEGMCAFDLPDVIVPYGVERELGPAQASAFGLAARMVCDGTRPADGGVYRNTESAPLYGVSHRPAPAEEVDDPFTNERGAWVLDFRG